MATIGRVTLTESRTLIHIRLINGGIRLKMNIPN